MQQQKNLHQQKIQDEVRYQREQDTEKQQCHKQKQMKDRHQGTTKRTTTDCEEVIDSLSQLSTSSMHKKQISKPSSVGKRRRTQANKYRKRNAKYQQELKAAADEEAASSEQDNLSEPMLG